MGIYDLIESAARNENANSDYTFFLDGDLCQMSNQKDFLRKKGFSVDQRNVYPVLKEEDVKKALELIWSTKTDGWWHYKGKYVELGICTAEEYLKVLEAC